MHFDKTHIIDDDISLFLHNNDIGARHDAMLAVGISMTEASAGFAADRA